MQKTLITSAQNLQLKQLIQLQKASKRRKQDLYLIEGEREMTRALQAGIHPIKIFLSTQAFASKEIQSFSHLQCEWLELPENLFKKISERENPDGWMMVAQLHLPTLKDLKLSKNPLILVTEGLEKPGNLGALIRSAESAGVDGLILCDPKLDPFSPAAIRNSQGAIFSISLAIASWEEAEKFLKHHNVRLIATTPHTSKIYWDEDLRGPIALLLGNEHAGLSEKLLAQADSKIKIPLYGKSDSLNVATAATLSLYEALRQRHLC